MNQLIKQWIEESLRNLFNGNDIDLINRKLKEECINHRLAYYLEKNKPDQYSSYYVDLEYNKNNNDEKSIIYQGKPIFIRPDILVHRRIDDVFDNLIAIECKKGYLNMNDKNKLVGLLGNGFNYQVSIGLSYQPQKADFLIYEQTNNFNNPKHVNKNICVI